MHRSSWSSSSSLSGLSSGLLPALSVCLLLACGDKDGGSADDGGGGGDGGSGGSGGDDGGSGGDDGGSGGDSGGDDGSTDTCSGGSGFSEGDFFLDVDGHSAWVLVVPGTPACAPVLLMGHGGGSPGAYDEGRWMDALNTGFEREAGERGFILVVPFLEDSAEWQEHTWSLSETAVIDGFVEALGAGIDIDTAEVLFVGQSAGGHMAVYQGLYEPGVVTRIAAVSSGIGAYFDYPEPAPELKLPFYVAHDPGDEIVPYSYSEQLAADLEANGHDYVFEDHLMGEGGHRWAPEVTAAILDWWLGPLGGEDDGGGDGGGGT